MRELRVDGSLQRDQHARQDAEHPYWIAGDYLRATALLAMRWAWSRIESHPGAAQARWQRPAEAFRRWVWPEIELRLSMLQAGA